MRLLFLALLLAAPLTAAGQDVQPPTPPADAAPPPADLPFPQEPSADSGFGRARRDAIRIGQDFRLAAGDSVRDAVVVFGNATIAGEVDGDLVVVLGSVDLAGTAIIRGDFVSVGGPVTAAPGASADRDFMVIGGVFNGPPGFIPGGEHLVIGGTFLGDWIQGLIPYLTRGLLWGRIIVPDLPWVWGIVALFFLLYLAINLLLEAPVRACAATLTAKPMTSFGAGLLVLLLVGPLCLLLAVSVIGIAVVPFVLLALLGGWIVGKVGVARWLGMSIVAEDPPDSRAQATRSVVVGFVLISIAYLVPVLGLAAWAIIGVLGLGASALAFLSAYRRENPKPIPPARDVPPPVPPPYSAAPLSEPPPVPESSASSASFGALDPPPAMAYEAVGGGAAAAAVPLVTPSLLATMPKALFRDRLAAFVLDVILLVLVVNILRADADELFFPLLLAYHIGMWTWKQTTVGGVICQLRVVRVDGAPLSFADALVRGLAGIFSMAVLFIGALWILRDPDSQAWHDKVAGTYVVKVPRNWPL